MPDLGGFLCMLLLAVGLLAVVGHGLWLFFAWIWRSMSAGGATPEPSTTPGGTSSDARLENLVRQLAQLRDGGAISAPACDRLVTAIRTEQQAMRAAPKTRAAPIPFAEAPPRTAVPQPSAPRAEEPVAAELASAQLASAEAVSSPESAAGYRVPVDPAERVREYAARKAHAAAPPASEPPATPPPPAKPISQLLAAFMEERNIRWGELVGGLLIVCGSIALVLSFWAQIKDRPLLQFFVFNGVTAGLFGLGVYAEKRMKLPMTSHGLLIIATLLVPLNFLALASFSREDAPLNAVTIGGELISIVLFVYFTYLAGQTLQPGEVLGIRKAWHLVLGVIGPSVAALVVRRFAGPDASWPLLYTLGLLPLACYVAATAGMIWQGRRVADSDEASLDEATAFEMFRWLGISSFAVVMPLALLAAYSRDVSGTLSKLAPLVSLLAGPALATGLLLWRKVRLPRLAGIRTIGTTIAVFGTLVLLAGMVLAWPHPARMLPVAVVNFAVLTAVALLFEIPAAHLIATACLVLGYLMGFHVTAGNIGWTENQAGDTAKQMISAASGVALTPMPLMLGLAAALWLRRGRRLDGLFYGVVAAASAVVSIGLVSWYGFMQSGDPEGATWVYGIYAAGALAAALWLRDEEQGTDVSRSPIDAPRSSRALSAPSLAALGGGVLLLAALVQGFVYRSPPGSFAQPWLAALLAHASLMTLLAIAATWLPAGSANRSHAEPWTFSTVRGSFTSLALTTSMIAAGLLAWSVRIEPESFIGMHALWLAAVWLALALMAGSAEIFAAFQIALTASVLFGVVAGVRRQPWASQLRHDWLDPWSLQAQGIALGLLSLGWTAVRLITRRSSPMRRQAGVAESGAFDKQRSLAARLLWPSNPQWDRLLIYGVLGLLALMGVYAALPGMAQELAPRKLAAALEQITLAEAEAGYFVADASHFEWRGLPHVHAAGLGAWLLLAVIVVALVARQWVGHSPVALGGVAIALAMACPLLAAGWESETAVASAWRWGTAAFLLLLSVAIWLRRPLRSVTQRIGWIIDDDELGRRGPFTGLALLLTVLPLAAMGAFVAVAAVSQSHVERSAQELLETLTLVFVLAAVASIVLWSLASGWVAGVGLTGTTSRNLAQHAGTLLLILGFAPLLTVALYVVSAALRGNPVTGPVPGTFFHRIGLAASYALPITLMSLTLVGYALRERSARFAFAAGLMFNLSATAGFLLVAAKAGLSLDVWIELTQLNAIVTGGYAIAWGLAHAWSSHRSQSAIQNPQSEVSWGAEATPLANGDAPPSSVGLLATYTLLGVAFNTLLIVPGLWILFAEGTPAAAHTTLGGGLGWGALALAVGSLVALARALPSRVGSDAPRRPVLWSGVTCAALYGLGALITFTLCGDQPGTWLGYHAMLTAHAAIGWLLVVASWFASSRASRLGSAPRVSLRVASFSTRWPALVGTITVVLAVREAIDYSHPWWAVTAIVAMSLLAATLAGGSLRRAYVYVAGALINLATCIAWLHVQPWLRGTMEELIQFVEANIIALALPCVAWVILEVRRIRPGQNDDATGVDLASGRRQPAGELDDTAMFHDQVNRGLTPPARLGGLPGFHRVAAVIAIVACVGVVTLGLVADALGESLHPHEPLGWLALAAAAIGTAACLWDVRAKAPVLGLYLLGLAAVGMTLDVFNLSPRMIAWMGTVVLAAYTIATSYLWSRREGLLAFAAALKIPSPQSPAPSPVRFGWMTPATTLLITVVVASAYAIVLTFDDVSLRLLVGKAAVMQTLAMALLAQGEKRSKLQRAALCLGVIGAVAWGWAWLQPWSPERPEASGNLVNRTVVVTVVLGAMTALYGLGLNKLIRRENEWTRAAQRLVPHLGVLGILSVLVVLGIEAVYFFGQGGVPMSSSAIFAVAATLVGLTVAALLTAIVPGRDPFALSERGRTIYVYAAEGLLALLFLHIRLTMPELFSGFFSQYWAFIVVFIAFVGVGLSEIFRRQQRMVLAEPLERTGALLPMLPVLGFFLIQRTQGDYSVLLILVGVLYAGLSVSRRSFGFGLLAALAANGGLWYYLQRVDGLGLLEHPQVWLIPVALCVLAAAYLNREQLAPQQMTTVRYLTSITIYVSSTADIFLNGMLEAPWLPLVLAGLSIAGIFLGIMLRVRAFLFLGTSFLVLALVTIIWHATVDLHHTWLLWVAVVVSGVLILALFALFEKKRHEVLAMIEKVKQWAP